MTAEVALTVLALNTGSSSLKFCAYKFTNREDYSTTGVYSLLYKGSLTRVGKPDGQFAVVDGNGYVLVQSREVPLADINAACHVMFEWIRLQPDGFQPNIIGHRVVHGGPNFCTPQEVNESLMGALVNISAYAPEHIPPVIHSIQFAKQKYPAITHVACFDTAFHRNMPTIASSYPLPAQYRSRGLQKYGFHGLSYEYLVDFIADECTTISPPKPLPKKIIIAHLGHGCSMAAIRDGKCIDTTMGFSPCGGFPMSTRSGDLDPEVVLFLLQHEGVPIEEMKSLLNKRSGLVAFSSKGDDMRDLERSHMTDPSAKLALDYFIYHLTKHMCGLIGGLQGIDMLVFSAGIGEHSALVRQLVCEKLAFLGITLDKTRNEQSYSTISSDQSRVVVRVIPTNEELVIAQQSQRVAHVLAIDSSTPDT